MTVEELRETLEAFKQEHGIFIHQSELIRALVKSNTLTKSEFVGPGFKITLRNPPVSARPGGR